MTKRKRPRGRCRWCGISKALTKGGLLYWHLDGMTRCPGGGQRPA